MYSCINIWALTSRVLTTEREACAETSDIMAFNQILMQVEVHDSDIIIAPLWKSGGYTGFALSFRHFVILWFSHSVTFQMKLFVTLFSGTVRPRILKFGTHVDSGQMYRIYWNQAAAIYLSLYFFIFLSLQTLKFFVTFFSGTVRPRRLKLGTHMNSGPIYRVYQNQAAVAAYSSLYFSFFFLSNFQTLKCFVTFFSGTVRPRRLKLGTHVDSGQIYRVYRN